MANNRGRIGRSARALYLALKDIATFPRAAYRYARDNRIGSAQRAVEGRLGAFRAERRAPAEGVLLVQMIRDYEFGLRLAAGSKAIADSRCLDVRSYEVDIDHVRRDPIVPTPQERLGPRALESFYRAFGAPLAFRNGSRYRDQGLIGSQLAEIASRVSSPIDLLSVEFEGLPVGDLLYDTYLRFFHVPTMETIDSDVLHVIEVALNQFHGFKDFLAANPVRCLLNSYSVYIHHGIPARLCLSRGIEVYTVGSYAYVLQRLTPEYPYHQINHTLFDPLKPLAPGELAAAERDLSARFSGRIDPAIGYMQRSAYADVPVPTELRERFAARRRNVVIFAHDFFDSPHVDRKLQFPDLYRFLEETLAALTDVRDTTVFVKAHPNAVDNCKDRTIELTARFGCPHFHVLDESVSNRSLIELRPDVAATARGTVALEMAYHGVPTVALYDNPYVNFDFVHTCMDKAAFFAILRGEATPLVDCDRDKIRSYFYQAFMEKVDVEAADILNLLATFKGDTYNDRYLRFLESHATTIFAPRLVDEFRRALAS